MNEDENIYGDSDNSLFVRVCINDQNVQVRFRKYLKPKNMIVILISIDSNRDLTVFSC